LHNNTNTTHPPDFFPLFSFHPSTFGFFLFSFVLSIKAIVTSMRGAPFLSTQPRRSSFLLNMYVWNRKWQKKRKRNREHHGIRKPVSPRVLRR
jgi:hypothetical protein